MFDVVSENTEKGKLKGIILWRVDNNEAVQTVIMIACTLHRRLWISTIAEAYTRERERERFKSVPIIKKNQILASTYIKARSTRAAPLPP